MVHRKALSVPAAATGLAALLLTGACGKPSAAPEPVVVPTISSSAPVTSVPAVANISVQPRPTTPTTEVVTTTEPPPPPPPPAPVQPAPPPPQPTEVTTTEPPRIDQVAFEGFPCDERGDQAVDPAGRRLVCEPGGRRERLRWVRTG
ncbi:hypothetical protein [Saccharothrix syringae]|uniref:Uncharacterized protein n=1 Tax=Saccharothrix syringae TaxID=103733 RepID=A0A5Q0HDM3_SACSY|nr:hypothetical protein [Saccharothrix syringae]QFZ23732.1 hypothetical protein EKG83_45465 [Saccharothrix syringae]